MTLTRLADDIVSLLYLGRSAEEVLEIYASWSNGRIVATEIEGSPLNGG